MKKITIYLFLIISFSAFSCKEKTSQNGGDNEVTETSAVCVWDRASLREEAGRKGKWMSAISLGEKLTFLKEEKEVEERNKQIKYVKVRLLDGKEGWIRADFVAIKAKAAVVLEQTSIYTRPDLSTISKNSFEQLDIIAVQSTQDDWTEVKGKRQAANWIETAWIKADNLSYNEKDIAVALYIRRAMAEKVENEAKVNRLKEISSISDLRGSAFDSKIEDLINELSGDDEKETFDNDSNMVNEQVTRDQAEAVEAELNGETYIIDSMATEIK